LYRVFILFEFTSNKINVYQVLDLSCEMQNIYLVIPAKPPRLTPSVVALPDPTKDQNPVAGSMIISLPPSISEVAVPPKSISPQN
jgi:hypothetical protein